MVHSLSGSQQLGLLFRLTKLRPRGLSLGNGHTCPFLGQPANNGVEARLSEIKYLATGYSDSS